MSLLPDSYVHRIGRTARAGRDGTAISFCDWDEREYLRDIEKTIRFKLPVVKDHLYKPKTPAECALNEVDLMVGQFEKFLAGYHDPLTVYGLDWLRRFVPDTVARVSLVQGDTGPVNFMFQGNRVSAVTATRSTN